MNNQVLISVKNPGQRENAVDYGVQLAKNFSLPVTLIAFRKMVYYPTPAYSIPSASNPEIIATEDLQEIYDRQIKELTERLKKEWKYVQYDLEIGFEEMGVIEKANEDAPFALVVGKDEEAGFLNDLFGTRSTHIAEEAKCPVIVIPEKTSFKPPRSIVFLTSTPKHENDRQVIDFLSHIANHWKAAVTVVIATDNKDAETDTENLALMEQLYFQMPKGKVEHYQMFSDDKFEELQNLLDKKQADIFAFQQIKSSFFDRFFSDFNDEHLILSSKIPVIVF